jgi:hypothetical protein
MSRRHSVEEYRKVSEVVANIIQSVPEAYISFFDGKYVSCEMRAVYNDNGDEFEFNITSPSAYSTYSGLSYSYDDDMFSPNNINPVSAIKELIAMHKFVNEHKNTFVPFGKPLIVSNHSIAFVNENENQEDDFIGVLIKFNEKNQLSKFSFVKFEYSDSFDEYEVIFTETNLEKFKENLAVKVSLMSL